MLLFIGLPRSLQSTIFSIHRRAITVKQGKPTQTANRPTDQPSNQPTKLTTTIRLTICIFQIPTLRLHYDTMQRTYKPILNNCSGALVFALNCMSDFVKTSWVSDCESHFRKGVARSCPNSLPCAISNQWAPSLSLSLAVISHSWTCGTSVSAAQAISWFFSSLLRLRTHRCFRSVLRVLSELLYR